MKDVMRNNKALKEELLRILEVIEKEVSLIEDQGDISPYLFASIFSSTTEINKLLHQAELKQYQYINVEMAELLEQNSLLKESLSKKAESFLEGGKEPSPKLVKEEPPDLYSVSKRSFRSCMSLSDYFQISRGLFNGNDQDMESFISKIDAAPSEQIAKQIVSDQAKNVGNEEIVEELFRIVDLSYKGNL